VDIQVARFLGVQVRFCVTRQRLPPSCDQRCALQRVQPCQWGLPPRIQRASTTAGYSTSGSTVRLARSVSPCMVLPPLCDVLRGVQVGVSPTVALRTPKVVAITGSHRTTDRALLARVVRIDLLDTDTSAFGFVRDELLELVEVPRVDTRPRTVLADSFEVFHPYDGVLELFRERDETTGELVIQVFDSTPFFVTHTVTCAKRTRFRKRIA